MGWGDSETGGADGGVEGEGGGGVLLFSGSGKLWVFFSLFVLLFICSNLPKATVTFPLLRSASQLPDFLLISLPPTAEHAKKETEK